MSPRKKNLKKEKGKEKEKEKKKNESISYNLLQPTEHTTIWTNYYFKMTCTTIAYCGNTIIKIVRVIVNIAGIYLLWILLHYTASHMYIKFCVPSDLTGFLISPFLTSTPHCQGLRWLIYNGATMINNMWMVIGAWICANLLLLNNNPTATTSAT